MMDLVMDEAVEEESIWEPEDPTDDSPKTQRKCILDIWAEYIRSYYPEAKIGLMTAWAYPYGSSVPQFEYFYFDQFQMYYTTMALSKKLMKVSSMDFVYPVASAVQNARSSYAQDNLNRDRRHLSRGTGRVLAAMLLARVCGVDVSGVKKIPTDFVEFSSLNMPMIKQSIEASLTNPYGITEQTKTRPELRAPKLRIETEQKEVVLRWNRVKGATGYQIYRKVGNGEYELLAEVNGKTLEYVEDRIPRNIEYFYQIRAIGDNLIRNSEYSNVISYCHASSIQAMVEVKKLERVGKRLNIKNRIIVQQN